MAQKLEANLSVITGSPIEIKYIDGDLMIIQKLDDEPNDVGGLTADELKAKFDEAGLAIQKYINETLIPAILAADATELTRTAAENERITNEVERVENENARLQSEQQRAAAENTRTEQENARKTAEEARAAAEQGRDTAEVQRAAAEQVRATSEQSRVAAEQARAAAEQTRAQNETARENKETGYVAQAKSHADRAEEAAQRAGSAQTAAAGSATAAGNSATAAAGSATEAKNAENTAKQHRTAAETAASNASSSAGNAASHDQSAGGAAQSAANSAQQAAIAAGSAAQSAQNAASAANEAARAVLEEAKQSGEFDGEPGYTPQKGVDYFDGDPYTLTDTDKNAIAEAVKASLTTELWTFTLEDGSVVPKAVYVGEANVAIVTTETNMTTNTNTGMGSFVVSDTISAVGTHILPKGTVLNIGFQNWEDTYSCVRLNGNIVAEAFSEETLSYNYTLNGNITISSYVNANPSSSDPTLPAGHIRYCIIRITEQ